MAAASFALASAENDALQYITFITLRPLVEETKVKFEDVAFSVSRKATLWERTVRYFN